MRNVILAGDVLNRLKDVPDGIVQTVVTSPPYYGLRDYGTATWEGGDPACDHKIPSGEHDPKRGNFDEGGTSHAIRFNRESCHKCGAKRIDAQIGLEETPEQYISKMVEVFREVRRVLRDDGTLWLNIGDSYYTDSAPRKSSSETFSENWDPSNSAGNGGLRRTARKSGVFKNKDLIGIPWMLAFALRADGWYLRQEIIWSKVNPMPESVTDRCTKSHEHIFLLTKQPRYFYDKEAIAEPVSESFANDRRHETGSTANNAKEGYEQGLAQNPKGPHRIFGKHKNNQEKG